MAHQEKTRKIKARNCGQLICRALRLHMGLSHTTRKPGLSAASSPLRAFAWLLVVAAMAFCFTTAAFGQTSATISSSQKVTSPAQEATGPAPDASSQTSKKKKKKKILRRGEIAAAPIPISSPAIGSGLVPVVGYIFPLSLKDKKSPPSVIGAAGLITNNSSRGLALIGQLFFKEDTYELTAGYVHGNLDYNIYGEGLLQGQKLGLEQTGDGYMVEFLRRIAWRFLAGPRFIDGHSFITVQRDQFPNFPIPPDTGLHTNLIALGAKVTRDTTPNRFYPVDGTKFSFTSDFFSQSLGSKYSFQSYKTEFDKYWSLSPKQVLAYDAYLCATGGTPPFYGNCIYGSNNELRGYTAGQYFDRYMAATQVEYRLVLPKRFGVVAFGGIGGVRAGDTQLLQSNHFLPDIGAGVRFEVSKKYHVNMRADYGQGVNGHTFGLGVLEAF
jgi:hypothetical protein